MKALKRTAFVVLTILFLIFTVGPFIWTFIISVSPKSELFLPDTRFFPDNFTWDNYVTIFSGTRKGSAFFTGLSNSFRAVVVTLIIGLPISMASGYALSRMEFPGRKFIKNALLITMVIPVMATIIPIYRMFAAGKMLDNMFWLCVIYVSSYLPMATWMITNYLSTIPKDLEEAALIDGCSQMGAFMKVILPLSTPILISVTLIMFLSTWSQFQIPLILASSMKTKPMAIVISEFVTKDSVEYGLIAAAGLISLIPPALAAVIFRKYLISGMVSGSVKG